MKKVLKSNPPDHKQNNDKRDTLQGYLSYPESEDIYKKLKEEKNVDPEDISRVKTPDKSDNIRADMGEESNDYIFISDLDIPGSELDDEQESVGSEDEENNYYSIGGDEHNNLDEDRDELL